MQIGKDLGFQSRDPLVGIRAQFENFPVSFREMYETLADAPVDFRELLFKRFDPLEQARNELVPIREYPRM